MSNILIFRNTWKDFVFTAEYVQVIVDHLVATGHNVVAYDVKRRRVMNFNTRKAKTIIPLIKFLNTPVVYIPVNFIALMIFAIQNQKRFDFSSFLYCRIEYMVLAPLLFNIGERNYVVVFGNIFRRAIRILRVQPFLFTKADLIIIPSEGHRERFVKFMNSKIKYDFTEKARNLSFPIPSLEIIKNLTQDEIQAFSKKYGIPQGNNVFFLGTCASLNEQHLKIIDQFTSISNIEPQTTTLIFPLTYSESSHYEEHKKLIIKSANQKIGNYHLVFLTQYLPAKEYLSLLKRSDFFINMRLTDQLAASVYEAFYSGNIIISGNWLPYSIFIKKNELFAVEINHVNELGDTIKTILGSLEEYKIKARRNTPKVSASYNSSVLIKEWGKLFQSVK